MNTACIRTGKLQPKVFEHVFSHLMMRKYLTDDRYIVSGFLAKIVYYLTTKKLFLEPAYYRATIKFTLSKFYTNLNVPPTL